ncbi:DEAD/DEAH box helicase family protein [soil metagenome]
MARPSTLTYDRGTLLLHPPPKGKSWLEFVTWDDRVEKFRLPARDYRRFVEVTREEGVDIVDKAKGFKELKLTSEADKEPYKHQLEALNAWKSQGRQGVVVLPTGAGKTYVAQLAMLETPRSTLIVVPTLDLMHQWYANLSAAFPEAEVGLLGGGSKDETPVLIATYDSAAIFAEKLGNRYGLLIFDECHHLPGDFVRTIAEYSLAPYRLGLTATPERSDDKHHDLDTLIGSIVYRKAPEDLAGGALAEHRIEQIRVTLSADERTEYDKLIEQRNAFLSRSGIFLGSLDGWQRFVQASARSSEGRAAMLAHRAARQIAFGTEAKIRVLAELLTKHFTDRVLIFTDDNATVYRISQAFLIPAITHQTKVKERHATLQAFRDGSYPRVVTSRVLNEGVDVPEANVAVVLSGTGSTREYIQRLGRILRKGEGKLALLYEVVAEDTSEEGVSKRRRGERFVKKDSRKTEPSNEQPSLNFEQIKSGDAASFEDL